MEALNYKSILSSELANRKIINSSYSLRAFARDLKIPSSVLCSVLNGKKGLSPSRAKELALALRLPEEVSDIFVKSAGANHSRSKKERESFSAQIEKIKSKTKKFNEISMEYFRVISDWYHFAILELTYIESFKPDYKWVAKTLGITNQEVSDAVSRLIKLELLTIENGVWIDRFKFLVTPDDVPCDSLKKYHAQLMQKGVKAVYEQDIHQREYGTHVVAIDHAQIPELKQTIRKFRIDFERLASKSESKSSVYCMSVQFFNLIQNENINKNIKMNNNLSENTKHGEDYEINSNY